MDKSRHPQVIQRWETVSSTLNRFFLDQQDPPASQARFLPRTNTPAGSEMREEITQWAPERELEDTL